MKNRNDTRVTEGKVIAALGKYFPGAGQSLALRGRVLAVTVLVQLLTDHIAAIEASIAAKTAGHNAVVDERDKAAALRPLLRALKSLVINQFGPTSQAVADFDFAPTPRKPTAQTRALAVDKVKATRTARVTIGTRKKAKVHGVVAAPAPANTPPKA
jgi:hypothetical protein